MATRLICQDELAPAYWEQACLALAGSHPVWDQLIQTYPERALRSRGLPYETLLRSLVGQQISVKAADAVWGRLFLALGEQVEGTQLISLSDETLRSTGLSRQKVNYARALSEFQLAGHLDLAVLEAFNDEDCMAHLCQVKGIGPWTAHMFLMFGLRRPDIWPVDDLGLRKGISKQFLDGSSVNAQEALQFGENLRPWRTVATWYLWRSLDPVVIDY
jgi:DNA-3-methyladenine glycosylase II